MFKAQVMRGEVEHRGAKEVIYVREATAREMFRGLTDKKDLTGEENAALLFSTFVVHENGSAYSPEEVDAMLDAPVPAVLKMADLVSELSGMAEAAKRNRDKQDVGGEAAKNG